MRAGYLRHQIWIKQPTHANEDGDISTTWGTVTVCWASIEPLKGREWIASGMENSEVTAKCRMRYYAGIEPTMQVCYGTQTFEIVSAIDPYERHSELELMLKELVHA